MREQLHYPATRSGWVRRHEPRGYLHPRHRHDELEFNLVARGTGRYLLDDRRYDLGPGCLVWLFPAQEHILVDTSADFVCWIGVIRPAALRRACAGQHRELLAVDPPGHFCRRLGDEDRRTLDALCRELAACGDDDARFNAGIGFGYLAAWDRFRRSPAEITGVRLHPAVERAAAALARDPEARLDAVARATGLSHSRLSRLFHAQLGTTLAAWRNRQRVERFIVLHGERRGRTLLALALAAGFGSYAQFHRVFRSLIGVAPAAWAREGP